MSTAPTSIAHYDLSSLRRTRYRSHASILTPHHRPWILSSKHHEHYFMGNHGLLLSNTNPTGRVEHVTKMEIYASNKSQQGDSTPSGSSVPGWSSWSFGEILSKTRTFIKNGWGMIQTLKNEVDMAIDEAETVTETVEKLAEEVEKVAEEVAEQLPDDAKLKKNIITIENLAKEAVNDAKEVEAIITEVGEAEKQVETILESAKDQEKVANKKELEQ